MKNYYYCIVVILSLGFLSCVKDVDFSQAEDLSFSPITEASLIYFQEPASSFVDDDGTERVTIIDSVAIDIFKDAFFVDNLTRADLQFEATNTINRAYEAKVDFFNNINELEHSFTFSVERSPTQQDVIAEHIEIFQNETLQALKSTAKLILTLTLQESEDGSILDENSPGDLKFRSKGTFYLTIDTSS